jgi:beta-phosphoglucomutase-like phosphatase (HAD superfamily)
VAGPVAGAALAGPWPPAEATVGQWLVDGMVRRIAARGAALMPGAAELLAGVAAAGLRCALVTSSERPLMDAVLDQLDGARSGAHRGGARARRNGPFDVTVCAADVTHPKPHPEPYLLAARLLGADPARCVVLEDAPTGVASAEAAGCVVVAVPGVNPVPSEGGRIVVRSLRDVSAGWLRDLVASRHPSAG